MDIKQDMQEILDLPIDRNLNVVMVRDLCRSALAEIERLEKGPQDLTIQAIKAEVTRARLKFPGNNVMLAALSEEHGELANALLELRFATIAKQPKYDLDRLRDNVQKEAIQVAAVAIRILEDGDSSFPEYLPSR